MSNVKLPLTLYSFIEEHYTKISNVDDIFNINHSDIPKLENSNDGNYVSIENLYANIRTYRKKAQHLLNLFQWPKEYDKCKLLENDNTLDKIFDKSFFNDKSLQINPCIIIESIGEFVKYHQMITKKESEIDFENKEITDSLLGSVCCYCDHALDDNKRNCNACEADYNDRKSFARNHLKTLNLKKINQSKRVLNILKKVENIPDKTNDKNSPTLSNGNLNEIKKPEIKIEKKNFDYLNQWKCNKCELINTNDFCSACLNGRDAINSWKCEKCKEINKFFSKTCVKCKKTNENIKNCCQCNLRIPIGRQYCDDCFNNQLRSCWNKNCLKLYDKDLEFCNFCKIQKYEKDYIYFQGKEEKFWYCKKCHNINKSTTKVCNKCSKKFIKTKHTCEKCHKTFCENDCKYCEIKCPICNKIRCKYCQYHKSIF